MPRQPTEGADVSDLTCCVRGLQVLGGELVALSSVTDGTSPAVRTTGRRCVTGWRLSR